VYTRADDPVRKDGSRKEILLQKNPAVAWRYSVVAENLDGLVDTMRYGITPEASKLNINTASEAEIERLLMDVLAPMGVENVPELVAALLDWRDADDEQRSNGAETLYYETCNPPYRAKNGPLDTIEELLLVKGFSAAILYGEDTNRNGILDGNENDGAATFPVYDNGDGQLQHGLASYITVWSGEAGTAGRGASGTGTGGTGTGGEGAGDGTEDGGGTKSGTFKALTAGADPNDPNSLLDPNALAGLLDPNDPNSAGDPNDPNATQVKPAKVDVNTASIRVLRALDGMTAEGAEQMVALRAQQTAEALKDVNWVVTSGALDAATYAAVKDKLTTQAYQFHVEVLGYADHVKLARRFEWIVEVRGSIVQVIYHRDLTKLGFAWPVDDDMVVTTGR
jgi:DNA uptake protein ComE-like DNA-binding protein